MTVAELLEYVRQHPWLTLGWTCIASMAWAFCGLAGRDLYDFIARNKAP
jgi:hypothetical protein